MTQKEMEEIDYALMGFLDKKSRLIVIEKMDEIGFTKRPQDNNALVPLDFQVIFDMLFDRTQYSVDSCKDIAEEICAKFGKDNSGMVLDKKEIRRTINEIQVPYADSQTGRIALTIYIDLIVEAIYSKFSQQPPKERKVSLEEIKIIKGNSY